MRSLLIIFLLSTSFSALAAPDNSNGEKFEFLHAEIMDLRDAVTDLSIDSATTSQSIESLESDIEDLSDQLNDLQSQIDTLSNGSSGSAETDQLVGYVELTPEICPDGPKFGTVYECYNEEIFGVCSAQFGAESYVTSYPAFLKGYSRVGPPDVEAWTVYGATYKYLEGVNVAWWAAGARGSFAGGSKKVLISLGSVRQFVGCAVSAASSP